MSVTNSTVIVSPSFTWPKAATLTGVVLLALIALYWPTFFSMVEIWERSETFTHGFLIFPISAWLIWGRRHQLATVDPETDWRGLVVFCLAALGWLVAEAGGVLVITQYALITLLIGSIWAILGWPVLRSIAFPLFFLYFAVPMGEFLIPPLMDFTANFTVGALQLTGIPVYREGTFFSIPSGDWSVVEGCSGLRYLIASFTLGTLYAYLTYRSVKRRVIFSAISILVPIIANGLRAYMIVMIAHLSDMKLALGVDHYIYGWVFFGIVMLILFWIGSYWREDQADDRPMSKEEATAVRVHDHLPRYLAMVGAVAVLAVLAPAYDMWLKQRPVQEVVELHVQTRNGWQPTSPFIDWAPHWVGADRRLQANFSRDGQRIYLELANYLTQRQDAELVNTQNFFIEQKHPVWSNVGESLRTVEIDQHRFSVRQARLRSAGERLLVWQWNVIDGRIVTSDHEAKLRLAIEKVLGGRDDGTAVIIATPYEGNPEPAEKTLVAFLRDLMPAIERALER